MNSLLLELLHRLEAIGDRHEELFDSDVRETMDGAIFRGFIKPEPKYNLPEDFAMFSDDGNRRVKETLARFLPLARTTAHRAGFHSFQARLAAFQNHEVRTTRQNDFNDFFGWTDPSLFDEAGNVTKM